jgi:hypothetical protein
MRDLPIMATESEDEYYDDIDDSSRLDTDNDDDGQDLSEYEPEGAASSSRRAKKPKAPITKDREEEFQIRGALKAHRAPNYPVHSLVGTFTFDGS